MRIERSVCLSLLLLTGSCSGGSAQQQQQQPHQQQAAPAVIRVLEGELAFGFELLRQVRSQEPPGANIFISPASVAMALGMAYNGAAGETQAAMRETLALGELTPAEVGAAYRLLMDRLLGLDPAVEFRPANSIWYREGLEVRPEFLATNRRDYDAEIAALDFDSPEAAPTINRWVADKTNGLIDKIVEPPIDPLMMLYLINAIYFKGQWTDPFQPELTAPRRFRLADGTTKRVPTMAFAEPRPVAYYQGSGVEALELTYGDSSFVMTIVMPEEPGGIDELVGSLTRERWEAIVRGLGMSSFEVYMPKFKMEYEITLNDALQAMGMGVAFDPAAADFTGIGRGPRPLYISEVKHKTYVDVNEEGTEAAAVTGIGVRVTSVPPRISVDRPFVFAIRERASRLILFLGLMMEPGGR
ncbi:MAG: serpin family protein [Gemmatimonadales bacterium]|jgi:serpin B